MSVRKKQPAAVKPRTTPQSTLLWAAALVVATLLAYYPAWWGEFVWDDVLWIAHPLLRDLSGLWRMWASPTSLQQYFPLTGTSFWLDHHLWGAWTLPYHLENVLLHACSALLLWRLLLRLAVPGAWLAAAIFALHPVMVESTAWITERKNVLSLALFLAALLAYGNFTRFWASQDKPHQDRRMYALAVLLFIGALLAKITAFSFPAVILVLAWWKTGRLRWKEDVLPVLPLLALSAGFGIWSSWMEKHTVGAAGADWNLSWPERFLVAGRALWFYIGKLCWPMDLCPMYPRWQVASGNPLLWIFPVSAGLVIASLWFMRQRIGRGPAAAAFLFAGTLFPVLGFMNVYGSIYSFVCDRWVYQPSISLIVLLAAGVALLAKRYQKPALVTAFAVLALPLLAAGTWSQSGLFKDAETLWRTTSERNPEAWAAIDSYGAVLSQKGQLAEAMSLYERALEIRPRYVDAHYHLANAFYQSGQMDKAMASYETALAIEPEYAGAHSNLAAILAQTGRPDAAIAHYEKALAVQPDYPDARNGLGNTLRMKGRYREACTQFRQVLEIHPMDLYALNTLAWELAACPDEDIRDGAEAVKLATRAAQLTGGKEPVILQTLAAAYAEARQYPSALATAQRALALATARRDAALVGSLQSQMGLYKRGAPLRDARMTTAEDPSPHGPP